MRFATLLGLLLFWPLLVFAEKSNTTVQDIEIEAEAWLLFEPSTDSILMGKNLNTAYPPASITKLMTNYILFRKLKAGELGMGDSVEISEKAWRAEGSRMFADVGSSLPLGDLLRSSIVQSGNDAAIALAEHVSGSEQRFTALMNDVAGELGLNSTRFSDSTGLGSEHHHMSALDIALLSSRIINEFPEFYRWYSEKEFSHNSIRQFNRNKLLWKDDSVDGLKTGYTKAAGYCLVATAIRDGKRFVAVILGAKGEREREREALKLLNYGFNNYQLKKVLESGQTIAQLNVYKGDTEIVPLSIADDLRLVVPKGRIADLTSEVKHKRFDVAPLQAGAEMGEVIIRLDNRVLARETLVAQESVSQGSLWKRAKDSIKLAIREWQDAE